MKWAFFDSTGLAKPRKHKRAAVAHRERTGWRRATAKAIDAGSPRGIQRRRKRRGRLVTEGTSTRIGRYEHAYHKARAFVSNVTSHARWSRRRRRWRAAELKTAAVTRVDCCRRGRGKESGGGGTVGEVSADSRDTSRRVGARRLLSPPCGSSPASGAWSRR